MPPQSKRLTNGSDDNLRIIDPARTVSGSIIAIVTHVICVGPADFTGGSPVLGWALASFAEAIQRPVPHLTERAVQKMVSRKKWQHGSASFFHPGSRSH
jgi:hypothetical protein